MSVLWQLLQVDCPAGKKETQKHPEGLTADRRVCFTSGESDLLLLLGAAQSQEARACFDANYVCTGEKLREHTAVSTRQADRGGPPAGQARFLAERGGSSGYYISL